MAIFSCTPQMDTKISCTPPSSTTLFLIHHLFPRSLFVGSRTVLMYFFRVQMSNTSAGKLNTNVWKTENNSILKL